MGQVFKTEGEVQEYLKNLHTEYQFNCHNEKRPEACHLLADYMESIQQKFTDAIKLYKSTCDQYHYARSCGKFGSLRAAGKNIEKDPKEGYRYLKKGCNLNDPKSCLMGGMLQLSTEDTGMEMSVRVADSVKFFLKACNDYRMERACSSLAGLYIGGIKDYIEPDFKKGFEFSLKACDLGNPYACANVSRMHMRGDGTEKNPKLAETFKKRAELLVKELQNQATVSFQQGT